MSNVLVFVEHRDGAIKKVTHEMITAAKHLAGKTGGQVDAVVAGKGVAGWADELGAHGVSKVYVCDDDALANYSAQGYAAAAAAAVEQGSPAVVIFAATAMGKDVAPRAAAKANGGISSEAAEVDWEGNLVVNRRTYGGKLLSKVKVTTNPAFVTIRPNAYPGAEKGDGKAETVTLAAPSVEIKAHVKEIKKAEDAKLDVTEANVVVSGGRGLKGPENWHLVEDLAGVLGAATGASRAVVDAGWRPHAEQVGQTGKVVSPGLYVAVGISGAIQHIAGMSTSKVIVAVNKDPEAPIFKLADYGIVGDAFEVMPKFTEEVKKLTA